MSAVPTTKEQLDSLHATQLGVAWHRFRRNRLGLVGLIMLGVLVLSVVTIPIFFPFDYDPQHVMRRAPAGSVNPVTGHFYPLGTDPGGKDVFTRLFEAGRTSLFLALLSAVAIVIVGSLIGGLAGFFGGLADTLLMRLTDFMLSLPLLAMYLFAIRLLRSSGDATRGVPDTVWGSIGTTVLVFTLFGWMGIARLARASVLSLRSLAFVEAAKALGANNRRIVAKHILPNAIAPIFVAATFAVGDFIILEATLSYFGLGVKDPPAPSWGNMLAGAQDLVWSITTLNPFEEVSAALVFLPSAMILLSVLSLNYIGDALRDALDPRQRA